MDVCVLALELLPLLQFEIAVRDVAAVQHAASRGAFGLDRRLLRRTLRACHALDGGVLLLTSDELLVGADGRVQSGWAAELVGGVGAGLLERPLGGLLGGEVGLRSSGAGAAGG